MRKIRQTVKQHLFNILILLAKAQPDISKRRDHFISTTGLLPDTPFSLNASIEK